ncbi:hypothetical protein PGB90_005597 [Kerria lacca]
MIKFYYQCIFLIILISKFSSSLCLNTNTDSFSEFVQSFKNVTTDFAKSMFSNLSQFAKNIGETISAAIEEECVYKCSNGKKPQSNPFYEPKANGCGVPGLNIPKYIPINKLEKCCNDHDICYGTCNKSKDKCDVKFRECLYKICSPLKKFVSEEITKGCKVVAKSLYTAVITMGCKYYLEAQKDACICNVNYYNNRDEL